MDKILSILLRKLEETQNFDGIEEYDFVNSAIKEYKLLQDKLKRRNTQIADLKARLKALTEEVNYYTEKFGLN